MIYVMNQKFLKKNIVKMVKQNSYFIIDGENFAITGKSDRKTPIATKYNLSHSVGGFTPETKLYRMITKKKKGEEINEDKYKKEVKTFLKDKTFTVAANVSMKALVAGGVDNPLNVFLVLPNSVYKYLRDPIIKRMTKLAELDFKFIYTQDDIEAEPKRLKKLLSKDELKKIDKATKHIEKKYKIKFMEDDD